MRRCARCAGQVAKEHRFCPWCGAAQRIKLVQFFSPHRGIASDSGKLLRVSHYVGLPPDERHVRFSVWNEDGVAEAAVSLGREEAGRLAGFIAEPCDAPPRRLSAIVAHLRADIDSAFSRRSGTRR